jgi:hypothetical protein
VGCERSRGPLDVRRFTATGGAARARIDITRGERRFGGNFPRFPVRDGTFVFGQ